MPNNDNGGIISFKMGHNDPVTGEFKRDLFWERMGAESGDPEAMIQMGFAYLTGDGVERDPVKAVEYYRMAADLDEPVAQYNMGIQCARGEGIKRDFTEAIRWMELASENGDADAPGQLKILKDAPEIERKAYAGDAEAQARFSTLLANYPSEENKKESFEMAQRSVEQGCPRGYHCLGTRYDYGVGVAKDPIKAAELYKKGAELGSPECQYCYAVCFKNGSGVPRMTTLLWNGRSRQPSKGIAPWPPAFLWKAAISRSRSCRWSGSSAICSRQRKRSRVTCAWPLSLRCSISTWIPAILRNLFIGMIAQPSLATSGRPAWPISIAIGSS